MQPISYALFNVYSFIIQSIWLSKNSLIGLIPSHLFLWMIWPLQQLLDLKRKSI